MKKIKIKIEQNVYELTEKEVKKALSDFIEDKEGFIGEVRDVHLNTGSGTAKVLVYVQENEIENKDV